MASFNVDLNMQMKTCPYNKGHRVKASRYQSHISKCAKLHKTNIDNKISVCPFNSNHCIPEHEFADHLLKCEQNSQHLRNYMASKQHKPIASCDSLINTTSKTDVWFNNKNAVHMEMTSNQVLMSDQITAEQLFEITEKSGAVANGLYLSRMSNPERKKFYAMLSERSKTKSMPKTEQFDTNNNTSDNDNNDETRKRVKNMASDDRNVNADTSTNTSSNTSTNTSTNTSSNTSTNTTNTFRLPRNKMPFRLQMQTNSNAVSAEQTEHRFELEDMHRGIGRGGRGRSVDSVSNVTQTLGIGRGFLRK